MTRISHQVRKYVNGVPNKFLSSVVLKHSSALFLPTDYSVSAATKTADITTTVWLVTITKRIRATANMSNYYLCYTVLKPTAPFEPPLDMPDNSLNNEELAHTHSSNTLTTISLHPNSRKFTLHKIKILWEQSIHTGGYS